MRYFGHEYDGFSYEEDQVEGITFKGRYAFVDAYTCGNYSTPEAAPYSYGCFIVQGPLEHIPFEEGIFTDYDDRLRGWHSERWDKALKEYPGQGFNRFDYGGLPAMSKFLSTVYGFEVECLQVLRGCNVGNGYPYYVFVSKKVES